jgi:hypothetical protein
MIWSFQKVVDTAHKHGFQVYYREPERKIEPTYCYYTDGVRIAYLQIDHGVWFISTTHIPNHESGTGFKLAAAVFSAEGLAHGFITAPSWAMRCDWESVRKWPSWEAFVESSSRNKGLTLAEPTEKRPVSAGREWRL